VAASRLFEQLQKAAVARAAMSPPPVVPPPPPSEHADIERAEIERIVAQQAQRLAELEREVRQAPIAPQPRFLLARGFAVIAVLLALVLGWFFVPWRTPAADPAKPPPHLKLDPKLDLGRPK